MFTPRQISCTDMVEVVLLLIFTFVWLVAGEVIVPQKYIL